MLDARSKRTPFPQTIPALLIAPLGAIAAVTGQLLIDGRADPAGSWIYWFFVALVCYGAEALFVVPFLLWWPQLRRPAPPLGAAWGVLVSWCSMALLTLLPTTSSAPSGRFSWLPDWHAIAFFSVCGLLSGLVYSLASRASSRPSSN